MQIPPGPPRGRKGVLRIVLVASVAFSVVIVAVIFRYTIYWKPKPPLPRWRTIPIKEIPVIHYGCEEQDEKEDTTCQ